MDTSRLSQGQMIAGVAAIVLFILMFLPWVGVEGPSISGLPEGVSVPDTSENFNLWEFSDSLDVYLLITIVITLLGVLVAGGGANLRLPLPAGATTALLGGIGTILVIIELFTVPDGVSRKYGIWLGLIAVAAIAVGGWMAAQERGEVT